MEHADAAVLMIGVVAVVVIVTSSLLKRRFPHWSLRRLPGHQLSVLQKYFQYYSRLDNAAKRRFEHLVAGFILDKEWQGVGVELKEEIQVMISASAAQLMFGLPDITLMHFDRILVYDHAYRHRRTGRLHQGDVNPMGGIIRISWANYLEGYARPGDAENVALHEMAHALWFEDIIPSAEDDFFDPAVLARWKSLAAEEIERIRAGRGELFRAYAATNQEEFFAVAVEYFFERPAEYSEELPELYHLMQTLLRQDPLLTVPVKRMADA